MADGSYNPDSAGAAQMRKERDILSNRMQKLLSPYLKEQTTAKPVDALGINGATKAPAAPVPVSNGAAIRARLQAPQGIPAQ